MRIGRPPHDGARRCPARGAAPTAAYVGIRVSDASIRQSGSGSALRTWHVKFDIDDYKARTDRLRWDDLDLDAFPDQPLDDDTLRVIEYMHDVELHTICYLRDLLVTPAHADPDVTTFLSCWAYEELWHGEALGDVLAAHGRPAGRRAGRRRCAAGSASATAIRPYVSALGSSLVGERLVALHMTWGAVNEWTTQAAYARLAQRADHPVLDRADAAHRPPGGPAHRLLRRPRRAPPRRQPGRPARRALGAAPAVAAGRVGDHADGRDRLRDPPPLRRRRRAPRSSSASTAASTPCPGQSGLRPGRRRRRRSRRRRLRRARTAATTASLRHGAVVPHVAADVDLVALDAPPRVDVAVQQQPAVVDRAVGRRSAPRRGCRPSTGSGTPGPATPPTRQLDDLLGQDLGEPGVAVAPDPLGRRRRRGPASSGRGCPGTSSLVPAQLADQPRATASMRPIATSPSTHTSSSSATVVVPPVDEAAVHRVDVGPRPVAVADDVGVPEVEVGREPARHGASPSRRATPAGGSAGRRR